MKLTKIQQKIFDIVKTEWENRVGIDKVDEIRLKKIIQYADTNGDGKKRILLIGEKATRLVPIEDIILNGIKSIDLHKYPIENLNKRKHKARHKLLHEMLDELTADFIYHTNKLPSKTSLTELMEWSFSQLKNPTHK